MQVSQGKLFLMPLLQWPQLICSWSYCACLNCLFSELESFSSEAQSSIQQQVMRRTQETTICRTSIQKVTNKDLALNYSMDGSKIQLRRLWDNGVIGDDYLVSTLYS
ncbi:hypothetical protein FCM35_KLT03233 [Carex littledalei]|uniref:Uncharacterized protein n=1 Tax=Carex littledalei TaxID=544730 RepID=A0A833VB44_9POAL|nr:hypothetical protein FCM35_KLT03233 [Carex littledalei]